MCLAIPGRVVEIHDDQDMPAGTVDFGGVRRTVCLAYVADDVHVGDYVIVHVGFALSRVDEREARRTLALLAEMQELDERQHLGATGAGETPRDAPGMAS
jgi:hydrogenase expression/formation protein HypC